MLCRPPVLPEHAMCGIAGIVHRDASYQWDPAVVEAMRDVLWHRGPDDAGTYLGRGAALCSRRLAILDLSERGHMPMASPDSRYWIVYNGEVYNYRELRKPLEALGETFASNTDTEVLLRLFIREGPSMLHRLNGMFAIAIWDSLERRLFLARDRLGIKPLYLAAGKETLHFASEEKSLFIAGVDPELDPDCLEELVLFRYVAGGRTPFRAVQRLLPGHYLVWQDGRTQQLRWWNLGQQAAQHRESGEERGASWFAGAFDSSVNLRRISDVPVGVLLSGGLDSSSVAASLAMQAGDGVASFTVRFGEAGYDEGDLARAVATQYQLEVFETEVPPQELPNRLRKACWFNDEPLAHAGDVHLNAIATIAKSHVTVLLSGEGADEFMGGYVRYQPLLRPRTLAALRPVLPRLRGLLGVKGRVAKLARYLGTGSWPELVMYNACEVYPQELEILGSPGQRNHIYRAQVLDEAKQFHPADPARQAMYLDQHTFLCSLLDRNDRMTMGASIECRVPFLDYRLVETLAELPTHALWAAGRGKAILRQALGSRLPEQVLRGRKWGFAVPWSQYLRQVEGLKGALLEVPLTLHHAGVPWGKEQMRRLVDGFLAGDDRNDALVRQLFQLGFWHESYFRELSHRRQQVFSRTSAPALVS